MYINGFISAELIAINKVWFLSIVARGKICLEFVLRVYCSQLSTWQPPFLAFVFAEILIWKTFRNLQLTISSFLTLSSRCASLSFCFSRYFFDDFLFRSRFRANFSLFAQQLIPSLYSNFGPKNEVFKNNDYVWIKL